MDKICCIGHITRDCIVTAHPSRTTHCAGGTAFYMAWAFRALPPDVPFHLITAVNADMQAEVERLREAGVSVTAFESPDNVYFENRYDRSLDCRTQRLLARSAPFTARQLQEAAADVFHLGTLLPDDFSPEVVELLSRRGAISLDVQGYLRRAVPTAEGSLIEAADWSDKCAVLRHTAILKGNSEECRQLTGLSDPHAAAEQIGEWGVGEVIVTLGSQGSLILADGRFYDIPAFSPRVRTDATGCGDTYCSGYLYARARGMDYAERGRLAAAMCALKLEHTGPFDRTIGDIEKMMAGA